MAIGGGHGLAVTLRAARLYASSITAIVSVADDGGSSGRLRRELGIAPPGDIRRCLVALAGEGSTLAEAFEYRFEPNAAGATGHPLGNLVLAGMTTATGRFQDALDKTATLLGAVGRVIPAAVEPVVLKAITDSGEIEGQAAVSRTHHIQRVSLVPADPPAPVEAIEAIAALGANDQLLIGPGSLYTSVLAAVTVPDIAAAIKRSAARRIYIGNLRPQASETDGYDVADHLAALSLHGVEIDVVLADTSEIMLGEVPGDVVLDHLCAGNGLVHDPFRLAEALRSLLG